VAVYFVAAVVAVGMTVAEEALRHAVAASARLLEMIARLHAVALVRAVQTVFLSIAEPELGQALAALTRSLASGTVLAHRTVLAHTFKFAVCTCAVLTVVLSEVTKRTTINSFYD